MTIEDLIVQAGPGVDSVPSSIAVLVTGPGAVVLTRLSLTSGAGLPGRDGTAGMNYDISLLPTDPSIAGHDAVGNVGGVAQGCTGILAPTTPSAAAVLGDRAAARLNRAQSASRRSAADKRATTPKLATREEAAAAVPARRSRVPTHPRRGSLACSARRGGSAPRATAARGAKSVKVAAEARAPRRVVVAGRSVRWLRRRWRHGSHGRRIEHRARGARHSR